MPRLQLLLRATCAALAFANCAAPPPPAAHAPSAVTRDWTRPPDFAALRVDFAQREDFSELCEVARPMQRADELFRKQRWDALLALAEPWLARCPIDIDAHMVRAIALEQLQRADEAREHRVWARGLLEAVLATGDGESAESAYEVIAVFEEYAVLRMLSYEPKSQSLVAAGVDAIVAERAGESDTIFFDVSSSLARAERAQQAPKSSQR